MRKPFRLLIGIPCMDYLHVRFVKCLHELTTHLQHEGIAFKVSFLPGTLIYFARNKLACDAINEGFTHLLFLDSDMEFDENIVETMMFSGKDFVCGAFQSRRPPYNSCIFKSLKPIEKVKEYGLQPFRVAGCGMACTMISTDILREVQSRYGECFDPMKVDGIRFGEDTAFCWRATSVGAEIWCDPAVRVGHVAHVTIWPGEEPAT